MVNELLSMISIVSEKCGQCRL